MDPQQSYLEYDGWLNIKLYHALDLSAPDVFTLRGNATVTNLNTGTFSATQEPLTRAERTQLKALAEAGEFYRLKAEVTAGLDGSQTTFLTSSKAVSDVIMIVGSVPNRNATFTAIRCAVLVGQLPADRCAVDIAEPCRLRAGRHANRVGQWQMRSAHRCRSAGRIQYGCVREAHRTGADVSMENML